MARTLTTSPVGSSVRAGDLEFPLENVTIKGRIDGTGIVWTVFQTFTNTLDEAMEAVYTFPLPVGGAVNKVVMRIGDRTVVADIKERELARAEYEEALAKGHTAMLMDQDAAEIFTTTVGNIHPGESITIETVVHDTVKRDGNEASVRFPTLIKPRFIPEGTPNAGAIDPRRHGGEVHVNSRVEVEFSSPASDLVCDTVEDATLSPTAASIDDFSLDRDVVLRWTVPSEMMDAKWTPDATDPTMGTVEVVIRKATMPRTGMRNRRALSILLDRSGSMGTDDMKSGIRVATDAIDALDNGDLVHVLTFDSYLEAMDACQHGFVRADNKAKASLKRQLGKLTSRGGTDLNGAISAGGAALGLLDDEEDGASIDRVVLLITDGAYGDEATAVRQRDIELGGARVIVVGIGQDMNGYLETLAANGWFTSVPAGHRVGEVSKQVAERIGQPAHRNAAISTDGLTEQAPHLAPDIYAGATVTLWGRAPRPAAGATVTVTADDGVVAGVPLRITDDASATTRWAKARINAVDYDVMSGRVDEGTGRGMIIALSTAHRVLSKYTSWVAVDTSRTTDSILPVHVVQPSYDDEMLFDASPLATVSYLRSAAMVDAVSFGLPSRVMRSMGRPGGSGSPRLPDISLLDIDTLRTIIQGLTRALSPGKGHTDWQSVVHVIQDLGVWLAARPDGAISARNRGKIQRRLEKLTTVNKPDQKLLWKVLNELLELCEEIETSAAWTFEDPF